MKTASECRAFAEQCREYAKLMSETHREQTLDMAEIWEALARETEKASRHEKVLAEGYVRQKPAQN